MATVRLKCDECGAVRQGKPDQSWASLRASLRRVGWTCYNNVDRCPACHH